MEQKEFERLMKEPVYEKAVLQITVQRIYTDVNGIILDKTDAAIPDALKVKMPLYVFGEYDRQGAYLAGLKNTPPDNGVYYLCSYVFGINNPFFFGFSGLQNITRLLKIGDIVTVFTDDLNAPNIFVWMVQSCPTRSLGSILNNLPALPYDADYGYIKCSAMDYYTDNEEQWKEDLKFLHYDMLGLVQSDGISPYAFKPAKTINNQFIAIRWKFRLDQYLAINSYMLYETDSITLTFTIHHRLKELHQNKI